jgi:hypothetical protein
MNFAPRIDWTSRQKVILATERLQRLTQFKFVLSTAKLVLRGNGIARRRQISNLDSAILTVACGRRGDDLQRRI